MRKSVTLYNVMFPIWFFFFFPTWVWGLLLPANLGIDALVLWFGSKRLEIQNWKELREAVIWRILSKTEPIIRFFCIFTKLQHVI